MLVNRTSDYAQIKGAVNLFERVATPAGAESQEFTKRD